MRRKDDGKEREKVMVNRDWQGIILSDLTSESWGNGHQHSIFFFQFESNRYLLTD